MPDLAALILTQKGDRSYEKLATDCGGTPTAGRLQQLVKGSKANFPDPDTINGLSRGLPATVTTIVLAAAESLGLDVRRELPQLAELLPPGTERLTTEQVRAILSVVNVIVAASEVEQPARLRAARKAKGGQSSRP